MANCSCGRERPFKECCGPLLAGERSAENPEELMRSRYSAFVHQNIDYLYETLDPQARGDFDRRSTQEWAEEAEFTGLEIIKATDEGNKGTVEFVARFNMEVEPGQGLQPQEHHEVSKFRKQAGVWYFRDGRVIQPQPAK